MRVSLVEVFLQLVVPWKRLVAIKGVAPAYPDVAKKGIRIEIFQPTVDLIKDFDGSAVP